MGSCTRSLHRQSDIRERQMPPRPGSAEGRLGHRHFSRVAGDFQRASRCTIGSVLDLIDRPVTFDYGYNMKCPDCPGTTFLSADVYHSEPDEAHVPCAHCGGSIHYGPAVMALRNPADPALDDQALCSFAWFHVSTIPDWPRDAHPLPPSTLEFLAGTLPPEALTAARRIHENQVLHLGTYEAAIEVMLRRMTDQDDGGKLFYLYRVGLHPDGLVIEPGWRDESTDEISQITQEDLGEFDVVRYLNVRESPGSISLGVRPSAIRALQRVSLPVRAVKVSKASPLARRIADIRARIEQIEAMRPEDDLNPADRIRRGRAEREGAPFARSPTPEQYDLLDQISQLIAVKYLPGISLPVRDAFTRAVDAWASDQDTSLDDTAYVGRFASMARLLTHPDEVIQPLREQPVRNP